MELDHLLSGLGVVGCIGFIYFSKTSKKAFLLYVLYLLPIMDLAVTPVEWGRLRVFDTVSYMAVAIFFNDLLFIKRRNAYNAYYVLFALFILVMILGSLNSPYIKNSLVCMSSVFPAFIYAKLLLTECANDKDFQKKVIQALKWVALFSVAFLLMQMIVGLRFSFYPKLNRNTAIDDVLRYSSFFFDPQMYGQYLVLISFLFLINYSKLERPSIINYLFFMAIMFALLQTGGRSAFLGIFAGMIFLCLVFDYQYKLMIGGVVAAGAVAFLFFSSSITLFSRVQSAGDDYLFRASLWDEAAGIVKNHPLLGIGFGNFGLYNMAHTNNYLIGPDREVVYLGYGQPESGYWMLLTEQGILGFTLFSMFILRPVFVSIKQYMLGKKDIVVFLIIAGIIGWLITFIAAYSLLDRRIIIVLVTLICLLIAENNKEEVDYEV